MFGIQTKFTDESKNVKKATDTGVFRNLFHMAASLRKTAASLITTAPQAVPSPPGRPPFTHSRAFFRRALRFDVDKKKQDAIVGFRSSIIGDVGAVHEFGERRGRVTFPKRPTLGPALDLAAPRIGDVWRGSIGS